MATPSYPSLPPHRIYAVFDGTSDRGRLSQLARGLLSDQLETWPDLTQGYASLSRVKARDIPCGEFSVRVQHNPGRIRSTTAGVTGREVDGRPCFLCLHNLPEDQLGILYRKDYLILCNPAPVFPFHFTICNLGHRAQAVNEHISIFLSLMSDLGRGWTVLYNGPGCGASAPDHLHFQAIPSGRMPVEREAKERRRPVPVTGDGSVRVYRGMGLGREVVILEGDDHEATARAFGDFLKALKEAVAADDEPMMSVAGLCDEGTLRLLIFPRAKHRPAAFFREGDDRVVVSPAVIEMGGVIVTPVGRDFDRLDASLVEAIFSEVSLDAGTVTGLLGSLRFSS